MRKTCNPGRLNENKRSLDCGRRLQNPVDRAKPANDRRSAISDSFGAETRSAPCRERFDSGQIGFRIGRETNAVALAKDFDERGSPARGRVWPDDDIAIPEGNERDQIRN